MATGPWRFYAAEISYFSGKVRPALRMKRILFDEILPGAEAYAEIRRRTGFIFLPTIVTDAGETLQDTSDILDALEERFPEPALRPSTPRQALAAHLWEVYCDEFMLLPALHYRWSFPESEAKARADFAALSGRRDVANSFADAIQRQFTPAMGVTETTWSVIEAHTRDLLTALEAHLAEHPYLLGERPSLADLALMGPVYAHLYLDAVPGRLLRETAPRLCHWVERMNHPDPDGFGGWLPDDALAPTQRSLLELIGRDAVPLLLDTARDFESWADGNAKPGEEPPRLTGAHEATLRGVRFRRSTSAYTLWMLQRVWDVAGTLSPSERGSVEEALAGTGCEALLAYQPRHRLGKRDFALVFEGSGPSSKR